MDAFTTNSSYWRSSGLALQQWVMYSYNVHSLTNLKFGIKFRTTNTLNDRIMFSKDSPTTREFNILTTTSGTELAIGLFKTNAVSLITTIPNSTNVYNNGKWHTLSVEYNSNGAGLGGVLHITFDGVTTLHALSTIDTIQRGTASICLNGRDGGYGPIVFDCEYVSLGDRVWTFSSLYSTIVYSNDGEKYFQSVGQTLSNVWKLSTDSYVNPYNLINGGYRYTNGNPAQDVILSKELEKFRYNSGGALNEISTSEVSSWNVTLKSEYFGVSKNLDWRFMVNSYTPSNSYSVYIQQVSNSTGYIGFSRYDSGVQTILKANTLYTFTMGIDYTVRITRSEVGLFTVLVDEVELFTVTDTTYTTAIATQYYNQRHYIVSSFVGVIEFPFTYTPSYLGLPDYTSYEVLPPLSFNDSEVKFYLPYNQYVDNSDTEGKIYDVSDEPIDINFDSLETGGFGDYIKYRDNGDNSFSRFIVKKKP